MQNYRGRAGEKKFAITFDMGDKIGQLPHILEVLAKYNNRATFFMTGQFLLRYPEWSRRVVAGGHEVGNHTFHHRFIKQAGELKTELLMTESTFYQVTGKIIAPYWRSPYFQEEGHDKKWLIAEAHRLGYLHFNATIDSKDWTNERHACFIRGKDFLQGFKKLDLSKLPGDRRFSFCKGTLKYLKKNQRFDVSGGILLMHASSLRKGEFLTQQLGPMMSYLQKNGYKLVTLTELIN
jgi:peptidoglycan/xylan/chitin deacetylase (PgdA/CDA1 family)